MKTIKSFAILVLFGFSLGTYAQRQDYRDVLNQRNKITDTLDVDKTFFVDNGAWHAYALPDQSDDYGGFPGPLLMNLNGQWLSDNLAKLKVMESGKQRFLESGKTEIHAFPGLLTQKFSFDGLVVELQLIFVSDRESFLQTKIENKGSQTRNLDLSWEGRLLLNRAQFEKEKNQLVVRFSNSPRLFYIDYEEESTIEINGNFYETRMPTLQLKAGETKTFLQSHRHFPFGLDREENKSAQSFSEALADNENRWNGYIDNFFDGLEVEEESRRRLVVKAIQTLVANYRGPAGDLLHGGSFPSVSYQGFYGFWSWDSWKIAKALAYFAPELAKESIITLFDYQEEDGMVPDVIYTNKNENNLRDTKPPLTTWGVYEVNKKTKDLDFLQELYPKLVKYHEWWYQNRDHDKNGICEYGSTDGTHLAATWESGMDNAVRFDTRQMLKNNEKAWSIDQESVDLNAYLYEEKMHLAYVAEMVGKPKDAKKYQKEAEKLKELVNRHFFDEKTGYYYDRVLTTGEFIDAYGPEGWTPLYVGLADQERADRVIEKMLDPNKFNVYLPLPTVSIDNPEFYPRAYWRGLVWLDQYYFGVKALENYGYEKEAVEFENRLFERAQGLLQDGAIHENYNPFLGEGRNAKNFGWSSAHILMLIHERYQTKN